MAENIVSLKELAGIKGITESRAKKIRKQWRTWDKLAKADVEALSAIPYVSTRSAREILAHAQAHVDQAPELGPELTEDDSEIEEILAEFEQEGDEDDEDSSSPTSEFDDEDDDEALMTPSPELSKAFLPPGFVLHEDEIPPDTVLSAIQPHRHGNVKEFHSLHDKTVVVRRVVGSSNV